MTSKFVQFVVWILSRSRISIHDRIVLTNAILDKLAVVQSGDILTVDSSGELAIDGRPIEFEFARMLSESARMMLQSTARNVVRRQVEYIAVTHGIHKAETPEQMLFAKAAIWYGQEEDKLYRLLAGEDLSL